MLLRGGYCKLRARTKRERETTRWERQRRRSRLTQGVKVQVSNQVRTAQGTGNRRNSICPGTECREKLLQKGEGLV